MEETWKKKKKKQVDYTYNDELTTMHSLNEVHPLLPGVKSGTIKHPEGNNQLTSVYFSDKKVGAGVGIRIILLEGSERPFKI